MNRFIDAVVNTEQLLQMSLYVANQIPDENDPIRFTADGVIVGYILGKFEQEGVEEFSDEMIQEEYGKLVTDFTLTKMVSDGTLDVSLDEEGEFLYKLSEKGKGIVDELNRRD